MITNVAKLSAPNVKLTHFLILIFKRMLVLSVVLWIALVYLQQVKMEHLGLLISKVSMFFLKAKFSAQMVFQCMFAQ